MFRVFERLRKGLGMAPPQPKRELNLKAHFTLKDFVGLPGKVSPVQPPKKPEPVEER